MAFDLSAILEKLRQIAEHMEGLSGAAHRQAQAAEKQAETLGRIEAKYTSWLAINARDRAAGYLGFAEQAVQQGNIHAAPAARQNSENWEKYADSLLPPEKDAGEKGGE